jgi:hypothetical protein
MSAYRSPTHKPAPIRPEPARLPGVPFIEAACRLCVWPISGAGVNMVVCGAAREWGRSYCADHVRVAGGPPTKRL